MQLFPYLIAWFGLIIIGVINGVIREFTYGKYLPELRAHQLSTFTGLIFFYIAFFFIFRQWQPMSLTHALVIGSVWLVLTIAFEFIFGRYVAGHSWERLLLDYNLLEGRLWSLVLLGIFFSPIIYYFLLENN